MATVTSVSGGATSSYLALHYPTDYNIFSLVRIEDKKCKPKDKKLIQYVEDKIKMPFIATAESDLTLYVLQQLEQDLGKEIIWVTGDTFEQVIKQHSNALPNRRMRFCTTEMKMKPIFWWCYLNLFKSEEDFIQMNIGYRADEPKRTTNDAFSFVKSYNLYGEKQQRWEEIEWRESRTPLKAHYIEKFTIRHYFRDKPQYVFPKESNCAFCFNKTEPMLQEQFKLEPAKLAWARRMEQETGNRFNISSTLAEIETRDYTQGQIDLFSEAFVTCDCHD